MDKVKNDPARYVTRSQVSLHQEASQGETQQIDSGKRDFLTAYIDDRFYFNFGAEPIRSKRS